MAGTIQCGRRSRRDFGKIPSIVEIPNLIEVQKRSYETFLQKDVAADRREEIGLQAVFKSVFPIADYNDNAMLEFDSYHFGDPKYTVEECHDRGMTFAIPLKVTLRLVVFDHDKEAKTRTIREQRGQEVYLGELPLMTDKGTFIINGTERVVVSQLQRSAGVFFDDDKGKTLASGKPLYSARVIPYRGSWVEFDFDANDLLHVRVDRRRKMYATAFLRAFWFLEKSIDPLRRGDPGPVLRHRRGAELRGRQRLGEAASRGLGGRQGGRRRQAAAPQRGDRHRRQGAQRQAGREARRGQRREDPGAGRGAGRPPDATRIVDTETGEVLVATTRRSRPPSWPSSWPRRCRPSSCWCSPPARSTPPSTRRWPATTSRTPTRRWSRSTASCGRAIRPRWSRRGRCSAACSWTPAATTWPGSAAS